MIVSSDVPMFFDISTDDIIFKDGKRLSSMVSAEDFDTIQTPKTQCYYRGGILGTLSPLSLRKAIWEDLTDLIKAIKWFPS